MSGRDEQLVRALYAEHAAALWSFVVPLVRGDRVRAVAVYEPPEMWAAWGYGPASGVALPDPDALREDELNAARMMVDEVRADMQDELTLPDIEVTTAPDGTVSAVLSEAGLRARATGAVEQSIEIVRRRVDETGVAEVLVARQGQNRILVQLPGIEDPNRIKELIGKTAKMTFHLLDEGAVPTAGGAPPPVSPSSTDPSSLSPGDSPSVGAGPGASASAVSSTDGSSTALSPPSSPSGPTSATRPPWSPRWRGSLTSWARLPSWSTTPACSATAWRSR